MAKNIYTTANGRTLNMDQMRLLNEKTIAVGNMGVNARGDQVATNGDIIRTRNEIMKEKRIIGSVVRYNGHKNTAQEAIELNNEVQTHAPPPTETAPSAPTSLRGSLASSVGVDLTNAAEAPKKTITRI